MGVVMNPIYASEAFLPMSFQANRLLDIYLPFVRTTYCRNCAQTERPNGAPDSDFGRLRQVHAVFQPAARIAKGRLEAILMTVDRSYAFPTRLRFSWTIGKLAQSGRPEAGRLNLEQPSVTSAKTERAIANRTFRCPGIAFQW